MSTAPQTSATSYFLRMKQEGRWNHHRAQQPGPTGTVIKFAPKEDLAWEEVRRAEARREIHDTLETEAHGDIWYCGNAAGEAREFFKLFERGVSDLKTLRADIGISVWQMEDMNRWKGWNPRIASSLQRMIAHREMVLATFDRLVENAHRGDSSQGENA